MPTDNEKPSATEIVSEIAGSFSGYVGAGVTLDSIAENVLPTLEIRDLTELLELHFILTGELLSEDVTKRSPEEQVTPADVGVLDFVTLLPERLRRVKSTTEPAYETHHGEVRGRIDWGRTIAQRSRGGDGLGQQFVCVERENELGVAENLVLIELLETLQKIVRRVSGKVAKDDFEAYQWLEPWEPESIAREALAGALESNVYLVELRQQIDQIRVDSRDLRRVRDSRRPVYREAAVLLDRHRRLTRHDIDEEEARDLLSRQFFAPDPESDDDTLFELYWICKLLNCYENPRFYQFGQSDDRIAMWDTDEGRYILYHDWDGVDDVSEENVLSFERTVDQIEDEFETSEGSIAGFLTRQKSAYETTAEISEKALDFRQSYIRSGEPDIVLLRYDHEGNLQRTFLGEVKFTNSKNYAATGLKQLYEYGTHVHRPDGEYLADELPPFDSPQSPVVGALFTLGVAEYTDKPDGLQILGFGDEPTRPF